MSGAETEIAVAGIPVTREPTRETVATHRTGSTASGLLGRTQLVAAAVRLLHLGSNVLLFGGEGSGRTAVLHEVATRLRMDANRTVAVVDGSGIDDASALLVLTLQALGVTVPTDIDIPRMLGGISLPATPSRVIAVDDVDVGVAQELFGRWRRHLWRLDARWVVVGSGDDPTPYLDGGADAWWEDGVVAVLPLGDHDARSVVARYLERAGVSSDVPTDLLRAARGLPRELVRHARASALERMRERDSAPQPSSPSIGWQPALGESPPYELSVHEVKFMALVRDRAFVSLADPSVMQELGWSYGKAHGVAKSLVQRGILQRAEAPGDLGRPRVVYSACRDE